MMNNYFNEEMFDLWNENIAIISDERSIIYTNHNWRQFATDNGFEPIEFSEEKNYLNIFDGTKCSLPEEEWFIEKGLNDVINGTEDIFKIEFPFHNSSKKGWFSLKITPLSRNYPTNVLLQHIDISERKEKEIKLESSNENFQNVLENVKLVSITLDNTGSLIFCNKYFLELTGWKKEEVLNKNWFELFIPSERSDEIKNVFSNTIDKGNFPSYYENEIITKSCDRQIIAWNNTTYKDPVGNIINVTSVGENITKRKEH